jgi:hypothetical protein
LNTPLRLERECLAGRALHTANFGLANEIPTFDPAQNPVRANGTEVLLGHDLDRGTPLPHSTFAFSFCGQGGREGR